MVPTFAESILKAIQLLKCNNNHHGFRTYTTSLRELVIRWITLVSKDYYLQVPWSALDAIEKIQADFARETMTLLMSNWNEPDSGALCRNVKKV